jgi:hypothetical protein
MFRRLLTAVAILATMSVTALASDQGDLRLRTTENLYNLCSTPAENQDFPIASAACNSFIRGAIQYHDGISDGVKIKKLVCYPEGATVADGKSVFLAWAKKNIQNTELMGEYPVKGLIRALKETYPCAE